MIKVSDLRNGDAFELEGRPFQVIKSTHTVLGRKKARVKLQVRNLKTGAVVTKTFISEKKLPEIEFEAKKLVFLYFDGREYHFKEPDSDKEFEIKKDIVGENGKFLKKNSNLSVLFWDKNPLAIKLPITMTFRVKETEPGVKGNSSTNIYKPAKLENGLKIKVPLFVKIGDIIKVDTRSGEYLERI